MIEHELGLSNEIEKNCWTLLSEVFIQAYNELLPILKFLKNADIGAIEKECREDNKHRTEQAIALGRAREIYLFFKEASPKYFPQFSEKMYLEKACDRVGISYERGLRICKAKEPEVSDFTKKVLRKVAENISKNEEEP